APSSIAGAFAGADYVEPFVVGRKAEPIRVGKLVFGDDDVEPSAWIGAVDIGRQLALPPLKPGHAAEPRIELSGRIAWTTLGVGRARVALTAIGRIGEPKATVRMGNNVIGRVEALAVVGIRDHRRRAVEFVPHDAPRQMLARNLPTLEIESVAVAIVRRHAEDA